MSMNMVKPGEKTTSGIFFKTLKRPVTTMAANRNSLTLSFGFAAAGRGTWLAQAAPAVARPVLRKDLLVKSVIRNAS